jgi:hypothetical protein
MKNKILVFVFLICFSSCSKDEVDPLADVAPDFLPYLQRFKTEAAARDAKLIYDHLKAEFVESGSIGGFCGYGDVNPPHVRIVNSDGCWNKITDTNKEILFFHELGHSILLRSHINDTLPNGDFKSMMFGGNQFYIYAESTPERRSYYLDELFNPSGVAIPDWAKSKVNPTLILFDTIPAGNVWTHTNQSPGNGNIGTIDQANYASSSHSLAISSSAASSAFSYWARTVSPAGIPVGSRLVLKVKVKLNNVTGTGVHIAMRGDIGTQVGFFVTTEGSITITGNQEFKEYSVSLKYFPGKISKIYIFLLMDGQSTGTAYFDDVAVVNYN